MSSALANGEVVKVDIVILQTLQVGRFITQNIKVAVGKGGMSLLGMNFLRQLGDVHISGNLLTLGELTTSAAEVINHQGVQPVFSLKDARR